MEISHRLPSSLNDEKIRLFLLGGKGGVGKTTAAAAFSLQLAATFPRRRFLVVSTDPAHSLSDLFDFPLDSTPQPVYSRENLFGLEVDAQKLLADFKARYGSALKTIIGRGTYLDEEDISRFLELSFPGLDELMAIVQIMDLLEAGAYDSVIVDTAPTGHTLRLVSLPALMGAWVSVLDRMMEKHRFMSQVFGHTYRKDEADEFIDLLKRNLSRLSATLCNQMSCRFVPVTLLEPVVVAETERLLVALNDKGISVRHLLVNQVLLQVGACRPCRSLGAAQRKCLDQLTDRFPDLEIILVPLFRQEVQGEEALRSFLSQAVSLQEMEGMPATPAGPMRSGGKPVRICSPGSELQFFLFCGKGGVGKTTLSTSFAFHLSRHFEDKRVLLFSTDPAHSLSDCLAQSIGPQERPIHGTPNLFGVEIDPEALFRQWKQSYSQQIEEVFEGFSRRAGVDVRFDRSVLTHLLDLTPPGLDELMALSHLAELVEHDRYDLYVLDTAPTGHTLRFLELPALVRDWLRTFFEILLKYRNIVRVPKVSRILVEMSQRVKKIHQILTHPQRCEAIPVTIPTGAALEETGRLLAALRRTGISVKSLLVNRMVMAPGNCPNCMSLAREHHHLLGRYRERFQLEIVPLPRWTGELRGREVLIGLLEFV